MRVLDASPQRPSSPRSPGTFPPCIQARLDPALLFAALQVMPIDWQAASEYDDHREEAEKRIADRDPDDCPTVALALELDLPVWTQDKDHTDAGIEVFTTDDPLDTLRDAGHDPDLA
jgi:hypothetical protein